MALTDIYTQTQELEPFVESASFGFPNYEYGVPEGVACTMNLSIGDKNPKSELFDGKAYTYPPHSSESKATHMVFVPTHALFAKPKVLTMPANDNSEDEEIGYHGLRVSDL